MKAIFNVKTIKSDWKPPFRKEVTEEQYSVSEMETFDRIVGNGNDEPIFQLESIGGARAKIKYSRVFMLKGQPEGQEKEKRIWLDRDSPVTFTYLWGEQGISKMVTYKGIATKEEESIEEQAEELVEVVSQPASPGSGSAQGAQQ
ncbi:Uncharacterised protein [uncultured archaeon]|nr:Uncharacterised protein [uncultured archaeon]